jgi:O-antigen ligase
MPQQWLYQTAPDTEAQYLDGGPLDRNVLLFLVVIALGVLFSRKPKVIRLLRRNKPLAFFVVFCAVSVLWSDFPFVAFKRWVKSLGDLAMILIVLTDREPIVAFKRLMSRLVFFFIPLSILFIGFYPNLAGGYDTWNSRQVWTGIAMTKNQLGVMCAVLGVGVLWRILQEYEPNRGGGRFRQLVSESKKRRGPLLAQGLVFGLTVCLLWVSNSMTAIASFAMAVGLLLAIRIVHLEETPAYLHWIVAAIVVPAFCVLFFGVGLGLLNVMGRDSTLTGRTEVWSFVLSLGSNPFVGTGFESFWLGSRLGKIWEHYWWRPNEAHNGYLEIYLNLGWIGLSLLAIALVKGYQKIVAAIRRDEDYATLRLAYFVMAITYSFTEAGFRMMNPVWFFLLFAIIGIPEFSYAKSSQPEPLAGEYLRPAYSGFEEMPYIRRY